MNSTMITNEFAKMRHLHSWLLAVALLVVRAARQTIAITLLHRCKNEVIALRCIRRDSQHEKRDSSTCGNRKTLVDFQSPGFHCSLRLKTLSDCLMNAALVCLFRVFASRVLSEPQ